MKKALHYIYLYVYSIYLYRNRNLSDYKCKQDCKLKHKHFRKVQTVFRRLVYLYISNYLEFFCFVYGMYLSSKIFLGSKEFREGSLRDTLGFSPSSFLGHGGLGGI